MNPIRRIQYTGKEKLEMAGFAAEHGNRAAAHHFSVDESNIRRWRKSVGTLTTMKMTQKRTRRGSSAHHVELEKILLDEVEGRRQAGLPMSTTELRLRAVEVARNQFQEEAAGFKASYHWATRFLNRHGLAIQRRTTIAQKLPEEHEDKDAENPSQQLELEKDPLSNADGDSTDTEVTNESANAATSANEENQGWRLYDAMPKQDLEEVFVKDEVLDLDMVKGEYFDGF